MPHRFDPGPVRSPFRELCEAYPGDDVYPASDFRTEWGPIFHRGRLDGSARVLVIGQDPAAHECIARRILVGEAGQRVQGFLAKLGVTRSYLMINAFLYGVYGQQAAEKHRANPRIAAYRNAWIEAILRTAKIEAVVAFGGLAEQAWKTFLKTPEGKKTKLPFAHVPHPTFPDSASKGDAKRLAALMKSMLEAWSDALRALAPSITPDDAKPLVPYGATLRAEDRAEIPEEDLPEGAPAWMRALDDWAVRTGTGKIKRATITVTIPTRFRP